jgi:hypothetical protein
MYNPDKSIRKMKLGFIFHPTNCISKMSSMDLLEKTATNPKITRVLLTLAMLALMLLVADPVAADCGLPPYDEPFCM